MTRILIVKMWALGDILLATPLLRALKRHYPDSEITWFADDRYADILVGNGFVDHVIPFDSATWRAAYRKGHWLTYWRISQRMRKDLKNRHFDIVINLTAEKWWAAWFAVAPIRIGLFPRNRPGLMGRWYTTAIPRTADPWLHNSEHYTLPAKALGILGPFEKRMAVGIQDADRASARAALSRFPGYDPDRPILLLHPGTSQESKCWPVENFAAVADALIGEYIVVITGSPGERPLAERIAVAMRRKDRSPVIAAGLLPNIRQTAALVEMATVIVTGDTSLLHIASALDTPVVGVYGSTRPRDNAPLFGRNVLLYDDSVSCAPCYQSSCPLKGNEHLRCLTAITPERVLESMASLVSKVAAIK